MLVETGSIWLYLLGGLILQACQCGLRPAVGGYVIVIALISLSCSYLMTETRGRGLSAEERVRAHS
jgi:hypothetical protein